MRFARRVFTAAAVYGVIATVPMFFLEDRFVRDHPPALTHAEFYYLTLVAVTAWQAMYFAIGRDPVRYRPLMPIVALLKLATAATLATLVAYGRSDAFMLAPAGADGLLGVLFAVAYWRTSGEAIWGVPGRSVLRRVA